MPARRAWLDVQLVALGAQAAVLAGDDAAVPRARHPLLRPRAGAPSRRACSRTAAARIDALLPGDAPLSDRLAEWDRRFEIPLDRLPSVVDWLVDRFRARAAATFGLPSGEGVRVGFVSGQPWGAYTWFDGGRRSRIDINTDQPSRATTLPLIIAHEAYPGHHLEHAWKEADLVDRDGRLEASILLINTPDCLISEGLANLGLRFAVAARRPGRAPGRAVRPGRPAAGGRSGRRPRGGRADATPSPTPRRTLTTSAGNAAILRHADGRSHDEVLAYLRDVGRYAPAVAAKRLEFIEHPLWRTYIFVYAEGEALLRRWLDAVPEADRAARFGRLLHEQLSPAAVRSPG